MDRRNFFKTLAGAALAADAAYDPERALWVRRKLISIPRRYGMTAYVPEEVSGIAIMRKYFDPALYGGLFNPKADIATMYEKHRKQILHNLGVEIRQRNLSASPEPQSIKPGLSKA